MSQKLQPARGTKDIFADEYRLHQFVTDTAQAVGELYGFKPIATPIFEFTEVFKRTLGDTSDIVTKEMYTFETKGEDMVTLRPEFTAGLVRAVISNGLTQSTPLKLYSTGPVFRYERPEKGRFRQFHQVNFELLGVAEPLADVEVIALADQLLKSIGAKGAKLELNSLGDKESRENYRAALVEYLQDFKDKLSDDSKVRLEKNPMRILDSKDEGDKKIVANAPLIKEYYSQEAADFFAKVTEGLEDLGIEYTINPKLVRGLDYYCHTAFEFTSDVFGTSKAVLAGGRYDGLMEIMGGPSMPAIGFAGGVERLAALVEDTLEQQRPVVIVPIGEKAEKKALPLAMSLRNEGFYTELGYSGNVGKRLKRAGKDNAYAAVIFGDDELAKNSIKLRDLDEGKETDVTVDTLIEALEALQPNPLDELFDAMMEDDGGNTPIIRVEDRHKKAE